MRDMNLQLRRDEAIPESSLLPFSEHQNLLLLRLHHVDPKSFLIVNPNNSHDLVLAHLAYSAYNPTHKPDPDHFLRPLQVIRLEPHTRPH